MCWVHHSIHDLLENCKTAANTHRNLEQYVADITACITCPCSCYESHLQFVCHTSLSFVSQNSDYFKIRKKVSENNASKICPLLPCLHSEVITSQLFTITWSLVLFTVVFKIGILGEPVWPEARSIKDSWGCCEWLICMCLSQRGEHRSRYHPRDLRSPARKPDLGSENWMLWDLIWSCMSHSICTKQKGNKQIAEIQWHFGGLKSCGKCGVFCWCGAVRWDVKTRNKVMGLFQMQMLLWNLRSPCEKLGN